MGSYFDRKIQKIKTNQVTNYIYRFKSQLAPLELSIVHRDLDKNTKPEEVMDIILKLKTLEKNSSFDTMKVRIASPAVVS